MDVQNQADFAGATKCERKSRPTTDLRAEHSELTVRAQSDLNAFDRAQAL